MKWRTSNSYKQVLGNWLKFCFVPIHLPSEIHSQVTWEMINRLSRVFCLWAKSTMNLWSSGQKGYWCEISKFPKRHGLPVELVKPPQSNTVRHRCQYIMLLSVGPIQSMVLTILCSSYVLAQCLSFLLTTDALILQKFTLRIFFFFPKATLISSITRVSAISLTVLFFLIETWLLDVESLMHLYADDISIFTEWWGFLSS